MVETAHGFFYSRAPVETDLGPGNPRLLCYPNIGRAIGAVLSSRIASLAELDTVYGTEDVWTLLEIVSIDAHNERVLMKQKPQG